MTVDHLAYIICSVNNHMLAREKNTVIQELLEQNNKGEWNNKYYKDLSLEDQEKYTLKGPKRISGKKIKREYGVTVKGLEDMVVYT